jgi:cytochrome c553
LNHFSPRLFEDIMIKRSLLLSLLLAASGLQAQDQEDSAKAIVETVCAACHMLDGNGNSQIPTQPKLAGQHADYLYKQLREFQSVDGKPAVRDNAIMGGMITTLPDEAAMRVVANHYAAQKLQPAAATSIDTFAIGQKIWRAGIATKGVPACAACHGPAGAGIPAQYPALAGQFPEYIEVQLKAFRDGVRANDPAKVMRDIALRLTDPEIKAVSDYTAGLR